MTEWGNFFPAKFIASSALIEIKKKFICYTHRDVIFPLQNLQFNYLNRIQQYTCIALQAIQVDSTHIFLQLLLVLCSPSNTFCLHDFNMENAKHFVTFSCWLKRQYDYVQNIISKLMKLSHATRMLDTTRKENFSTAAFIAYSFLIQYYAFSYILFIYNSIQTIWLNYINTLWLFVVFFFFEMQKYLEYITKMVHLVNVSMSPFFIFYFCF